MMASYVQIIVLGMELDMVSSHKEFKWLKYESCRYKLIQILMSMHDHMNMIVWYKLWLMNI